MIYGMGDVSATTLTDRDGRYVLCGLNGHDSTYNTFRDIEQPGASQDYGSVTKSNGGCHLACYDSLSNSRVRYAGSTNPHAG